MRQLQTGSTRQWSKRLPEIIFCLTVIINIVTTWYVVGHYLDSDASSEMVLAQHWIDTGNILSDDWIYGSEIRLFHMQLIYAPLLLIFDSWQTVRFWGAIIMQGIYLASYGYLLRQAGLGKKQFYLGGPCSCCRSVWSTAGSFCTITTTFPISPFPSSLWEWFWALPGRKIAAPFPSGCGQPLC